MTSDDDGLEYVQPNGQAVSNSSDSYEDDSEEEYSRVHKKKRRRERAKQRTTYGTFLSSDENESDNDNVFFRRLDREGREGAVPEVKFVNSRVEESVQLSPTSAAPPLSLVEGFSSSASSSSEEDEDDAEDDSLSINILFKRKTEEDGEEGGFSRGNSLRSIGGKKGLEKQYGVGFSLMAKMGYKGGGLGTEGGGMVKPIEVIMRRKNEGIREGESRSTRKEDSFLEKIDELLEGDGRVGGRDRTERGTLGDAPQYNGESMGQEVNASAIFQRRKRKKERLESQYESYKSALSAAELPLRPRVIDMRGPDVQIGENVTAFMRKPLEEQDVGFDFPHVGLDPDVQKAVGADWLNRMQTDANEMADNAESLQRMLELQEKLNTLKNAVTPAKDATASLMQPPVNERQATLIAKYRPQLSSERVSPTSSIMDEDDGYIGSIGVPKPSKPEAKIEERKLLAFRDLTQRMRELKKTYSEDIAHLDLHAVIADQILRPALEAEAKSTLQESLEQNTFSSRWLKSDLLFWRGFLQPDAHSRSKILSSVVRHAITEAVVTPFFASTKWDCVQDTELGLKFTHDWLRLWVTEEDMSEFVEQTIAERLIFEIESGRWSPETQDGPPHLWLHPWFALCSPRTVERISKKVLERFHEVILHRGWTPTDRSIVETLKPWKWSLLGHDDSLAYEQILAQVKHSIDLYLSECSADLDPDLPSLLKTLKEDWAPCGVMPNRLSQAVVDYFAPRLFRRMDRITGVLRRKAEGAPTLTLAPEDRNLIDPDYLMRGYDGWRSLAPKMVKDEEIINLEENEDAKVLALAEQKFRDVMSVFLKHLLARLHEIISLTAE